MHLTRLTTLAEGGRQLRLRDPEALWRPTRASGVHGCSQAIPWY